jgi:DHA1 family tetracycline resistance protein-like MFS transporter
MSRRKPAIVFIFITLFLDIFGIGVVVPVLPKLVEQMTGGDLTSAAHNVGWLSSIYALMQFVFAPVLGSLSDRFGRRPVILLSLFGSALDYLLLAWAPTLAWFFVGRVISGITAANFSAASAYIADVTPPEKRAAGFGIIGAAFGLGFIAGPLIGGWLGEFGLRVPFIAAAGITLLNWLYGMFVLPESLAPEHRREFHWSSVHPINALRTLGRWPVVAGLAGTHFLINVAHNIYPTLWVLYTGKRYGWGPHEVGVSLSLVGVMAAIVQAGLAGRILAVIGERRGVYVGLIAMAGGLAAYGFASAAWMVYVIIVVASLGSIGTPAAQSIITRSVPPDQQGAVQGALASLTSMSGIVGPILWTWIFGASISQGTSMSWSGLAFFGAGAVTLAGLWLAWRALHLRNVDAAR